MFKGTFSDVAALLYLRGSTCDTWAALHHKLSIYAKTESDDKPANQLSDQDLHNTCTYSRSSMARTPMARLPWMSRTRSCPQGFPPNTIYG